MPGLAPPISFSHLDALSKRIEVDGAPMRITSIYADAPSYEPIGDPDEGISALDDVARATVAYLDEHERTGSVHALEQARGGLEFARYMQQPDGTFANFITDERGTKNLTGATSRPELGWWTFRGMWALARGYRAFRDVDPKYARSLRAAYERTERALATAIDQVGPGSTSLRGREVPAWLERFSPDAASVAAIALAEMQEARPDERTGSLLERIADGVAQAQLHAGRDGAFDHAAHTTSNPEHWHSWGAHEGEALARAGQLLGRPDLVAAARREVEGLLAWQLAAGRIQELAPGPVREGQQAYGVAMAVRGAMALHRATGEERYARIAGLHASWFAGNNMAGEPMYDPKTGRGYDGIDAPPRGVNRSSGAESTIEAIMTQQAIAASPAALAMSRMRPVSPPHTWTQVGAGELRLAPGARATMELRVDQPGEYVLLGAHMRNAAAGAGTSLVFSIDGRPAATLPARSGSDGPHVALDRADGAPIRLDPGTHRVDIVASGGQAASPARISSLVLHPTVARTRLAGPDGVVDVSWSIDEGRLRIEPATTSAAATPGLTRSTTR